VESALINEKKAEQLEAKVQEALAAAGGDLAAAAENLGVTVNNAQGATFGANFVPKLGAEPEVLGVLFGLDMDETSGPIAGKQGVYVVKPTNLTQADELPDASPVRNRIAGQERNRLGVTNLLESLKESSEIVDNHRSFNL
jgi:parvulin-like peptidyl-prolyl isomerase